MENEIAELGEQWPKFCHLSVPNIFFKKEMHREKQEMWGR